MGSRSFPSLVFSQLHNFFRCCSPYVVRSFFLLVLLCLSSSQFSFPLPRFLSIALDILLTVLLCVLSLPTYPPYTFFGKVSVGVLLLAVLSLPICFSRLGLCLRFLSRIPCCPPCMSS